MNRLRRLKIVLLSTGILLAAPPAPAQIVVRKTAGTGNPTLTLDHFDGPRDARQALLRALRFADWFQVVPAPGPARYHLRLKTVGTPPRTAVVDLRLEDGAPAAAFRVQSSTPNRLMFHAVDGIIRNVFHAPGLCASRIAFAAGDGRVKEIFTCDFDGADIRQLTHNGTISTEPSWGPGAATMVYTLYGVSTTDVILLDLVNRRQRRLSQFPGLNSGADISPDGRWAALCLSRGGAVDLYLLGITSGTLRRLTHDAAVDASPCWGPDARRICFVSDRAGRPHLYVIPAAGGRPVRVTRNIGETVSPDWSAVSNHLVFSLRRGGRYLIGTVDMGDPARAIRIATQAPGDWEAPSWAPDGRHVVCTRTQGGRRQLVILDTWYGGFHAITAPGSCTLPSWSDLY